MSSILFIFIYFVFIFLFMNFLYSKCCIYYKPLEYIDKKTGEKINVHKKYEPFQAKDSLSYLNFLINGMIFFPIKFVTCVSVVSGLIINLKISSYFHKNSDTNKKDREITKKIIQFWSKWAFKMANITIHEIKINSYEKTYKKYLGENYDFTDQKYSVIISNHLGLFDVILQMFLHGPGFIAKKQVGDYPLFGSVARGLNCLLVSRENEKERQKTMDLIYQKQKNFIDGKSLSPLVIFPEGTTTSNRNILKFKKGAFYHLLPIKPQIIKIDQNSPVHIACGAQNICFHTWKLLSFYRNDIYYMDLPVIKPTEFMFENYKNYGKEKWEIFAEVTRKIYCEIGGFTESDLGYRDSDKYYLSMVKGKYEPEDEKEKSC